MYDFMWIKSLRWIEKWPEKRWEYYVWKESMRICWNVYGLMRIQYINIYIYIYICVYIYDLMRIKSLRWVWIMARKEMRILYLSWIYAWHQIWWIWIICYENSVWEYIEQTNGLMRNKHKWYV